MTRAIFFKKRRHADPDRGLLSSFWRRLKVVKEFSTVVRALSPQNGEGVRFGRGTVAVLSEQKEKLLFKEEGLWLLPNEQKIAFHNVYRWTLDPTLDRIGLEHLRQGMHHPVFLLYFAPDSENSLCCIDSHFCGQDSYSARVDFKDNKINLSWQIKGPKKNEEIECCYIAGKLIHEKI